MELPYWGRRAAAAALLQPPLAVAPGGVSGRSVRDVQPAAAATQADKAMGEVLTAVTANMIESSRRARPRAVRQVGQKAYCACGQPDEAHPGRAG